jgi:tRNA-dihydrouridine synthase 2
METDGPIGTKFGVKQACSINTQLTVGADSVMIARSAERNPSIFLPAGPRCNITEVVPKFLNICEYIDNPWGNTKFLLAQYRPSAAPISSLSKSEKKAAQEAVTRSKSLIEVAEQLRITLGGGKEVMKDIADSISARTKASVFDERADAVAQGIAVDEETTQ